MAPVVKITPTNPGWGKGVYSAADNPGFDISVTDPVVNDAYAGLKTISYTITNGTTGYVESGTLANLERTSHLQGWTGHITINPDNFYSNDVRVKLPQMTGPPTMQHLKKSVSKWITKPQS